MLFIRGGSPLSFRRLSRHELPAVAAIELDPDQISRFLGPVDAIVSAVERGSAHSLIGISAADSLEETLLGFYVIHPEPRDASCWWLGWIALDRRRQGRGYGRLALAHALDRMRRLDGCRRVRLLVAPDNARACALYADAGFKAMGRLATTGELVLELPFSSPTDSDGNEAFILQAVAARARRVFRHRRLRLTVGPHASWVIGVERGPPLRSVMRRVDTARRAAHPAPCRSLPHLRRAQRPGDRLAGQGLSLAR